MNDSKSYQPSDKMRDLVRNDSALILIMGRFGISLGFGDKTVREICRANNVDEKTFLAVANYATGRDCRFEEVSLPTLIRYLKQSHEYFLDFNLPSIRRKLIEAIDCSGSNDIAILIIRFYDEYVMAVRKHMEYENDVVFSYVEQLSSGHLQRNYTITEFASKHAPIGDKLKELKDVIIRCYPEKNNYLLNAALLEIISCEQDLTSHCLIEDKLFVPAVKFIEQQLKKKGDTVYVDKTGNDAIDKRDKLETLSDREKDIIACVTKGMSNKEIADALYLSVHTVTTHRRNISNKLQIHTTAGLTIYAIANKLVNIEEIQVG
ncbi:helix-turn-helix transcriptional regulator [uncultured Bacteroides sp.]|uniref:helix-turn-helix transcriptional regulator n=1 Tax=uncultured Bacteroides sp. TaxID=162156 RepID=UPI0026184D64|nr:helix-turn-helix transcriptional regulator [uncultured Bacteroides sp.]